MKKWLRWLRLFFTPRSVILKRIAKLEAEIETYQQSSPSKKDKEKEEFDK